MHSLNTIFPNARIQHIVNKRNIPCLSPKLWQSWIIAYIWTINKIWTDLMSLSQNEILYILVAKGTYKPIMYCISVKYWNVFIQPSMVNIIFLNHTPLCFVSLPVCFSVFLINSARLCPWFVCFLLIITNMGWNIWVTKIDIMTEYALLFTSYIRLANFWGKAKCLGNITSHLSSPSH